MGVEIDGGIRRGGMVVVEEESISQARGEKFMLSTRR